MKPHSLKSEFAWTKWTPKDITRQARAILIAKKKALAAIKKIPPAQRTFENTIYALEASDYPYGDSGSLIEFLMQVSPNNGVRDTATKVVKELQEKMLELAYDEGVYRAVKEYTAKNEQLSGPDKKLLRDMLRSYRRMGFELPTAKRRILKKNLKVLQRLGVDFSKNINDYHDFITVTKEELTGLSERYIASLPRDKAGNLTVSLRYPEYIPFVENASRADKREELVRKQLHKGGPANVDVAKKILALREKNARLLGFAHHGDFVNEVKMSKNAKTVQHFLLRLARKVQPLLRKDLDALRELKRAETENPKAELAFYDAAYYINMHKKRHLDLDTEKIREYFPLQTVIAGMLTIYSRILGVRFQKLSGLPAWHEDVEHYEVQDRSGELLGYFMLDLYPRPNKFSHAAMWQLRSSRHTSWRNRNRVLPIIAMVTNFSKPTKEHPSLLTHSEVETFFHEFGHVMHGMLSQTRYASQSGTSVVGDFVEAPSQMLENWVWNEKTLALLSGHYLNSKEKLPKPLLAKLAKAKKHMIGYVTMRQIVMGLLDIFLHTKQTDLKTGYQKLTRKYIGIQIPSDALFMAGFGHFVGYDAGYYGYLWSDVYASDMFTRFKKEGLLNPKTGRDYRTWILEKGSSMEPMELLERFLGRKPNEKAFLKEIGLKT